MNLFEEKKKEKYNLRRDGGNEEKKNEEMKFQRLTKHFSRKIHQKERDQNLIFCILAFMKFNSTVKWSTSFIGKISVFFRGILRGP